MFKQSDDGSIRLATVIATGQRFIVQRLTIGETPDGSRCHTWGHLKSFKGLASKHVESKTFRLDAVTIVETTKTVALLQELMEQYITELQEQGWIVHRTRSGNYKLIGKTGQMTEVA